MLFYSMIRLIVLVTVFCGESSLLSMKRSPSTVAGMDRPQESNLLRPRPEATDILSSEMERSDFIDLILPRQPKVDKEWMLPWQSEKLVMLDRIIGPDKCELFKTTDDYVVGRLSTDLKQVEWKKYVNIQCSAKVFICCGLVERGYKHYYNELGDDVSTINAVVEHMGEAYKNLCEKGYDALPLFYASLEFATKCENELVKACWLQFQNNYLPVLEASKEES